MGIHSYYSDTVEGKRGRKRFSLICLHVHLTHVTKNKSMWVINSCGVFPLPHTVTKSHKKRHRQGQLVVWCLFCGTQLLWGRGGTLLVNPTFTCNLIHRQVKKKPMIVVCNTLAGKLLYVAALCCLLPSSSLMSLRQIKRPPCYMC